MRENVITCLFLGIMFMRNNFTLMWNMIAKGFGPTCFTAWQKALHARNP